MPNHKTRNLKLVTLHFIILMLVLAAGCATGKVPAVFQDQEAVEYITSLSVEESWRAVMRFTNKYDYRLINLDSDKGIMEISGGDNDASGYNVYGLHYTLIFMGLEKGTKVVIEGSFYNNNGKEIAPQSSWEKIKKEKELRLLAALKKYFETELNHGAAKRTI